MQLGWFSIHYLNSLQPVCQAHHREGYSCCDGIGITNTHSSLGLIWYVGTLKKQWYELDSSCAIVCTNKLCSNLLNNYEKSSWNRIIRPGFDVVAVHLLHASTQKCNYGFHDSMRKTRIRLRNTYAMTAAEAFAYPKTTSWHNETIAIKQIADCASSLSQLHQPQQ